MSILIAKITNGYSSKLPRYSNCSQYSMRSRLYEKQVTQVTHGTKEVIVGVHVNKVKLPSKCGLLIFNYLIMLLDLHCHHNEGKVISSKFKITIFTEGKHSQKTSRFSLTDFPSKFE